MLGVWNDSCIKMGSDGRHFNVSLTVMDKVTRQCPQTNNDDDGVELNFLGCRLTY